MGEGTAAAPECEERYDMTKLPSELYDTDTIVDMPLGAVRWTTPWAMTVTGEGECILCASYRVHPTPGGTMTMRLERLEDGWHVTVPRDYRYQPRSGIPWVGATTASLVPVASVKVRTDVTYGVTRTASATGIGGVSHRREGREGVSRDAQNGI